MKNRIIELFKENQGAFLSGQKLSSDLGISRSAIWKYINTLKEEGYKFEASSKKGYKLISKPDLLSQAEISSELKTKFIGKNIIHFDTINSTNLRAKELAAGGAADGTVLISEEQTAGKGRLGRNWVSPKYKGIWMSIILRPALNPAFASKITLIGAAAVYKSIKELGVDVLIKWPNDIVLNGKKVCGILTEMSAELNNIHYLVIGIGINVNVDEQDFPSEIKSTATSLKIEIGNFTDRKKLTSAILNNFEVLYSEFVVTSSAKTSIDICRENSVLIGREIKIINAGQETIARALDINSDGELVVQYTDGTIHTVFSGEISMRGLNGYV